MSYELSFQQLNKASKLIPLIEIVKVEFDHIRPLFRLQQTMIFLTAGSYNDVVAEGN